MGYWLVTEVKFVTNQTSYITAQMAACRCGISGREVIQLTSPSQGFQELPMN